MNVSQRKASCFSLAAALFIVNEPINLHLEVNYNWKHVGEDGALFDERNGVSKNLSADLSRLT